MDSSRLLKLESLILDTFSLPGKWHYLPTVLFRSCLANIFISWTQCDQKGLPIFERSWHLFASKVAQMFGD